MDSKEVIYFVSDFHLGADGDLSSKEREQKVVRFLDSIRVDATTIYLLGDVFDYWFEYRSVVPKGFVRLLGKLAELSDAGIKIEFFTGNHDLWMFSYFESELQIPIHKYSLKIDLGGTKMIIGHGDGLGPGDKGYKFIKKVFSNKLLQRLFGSLHPNIGLKIMRRFSKKSRDITGDENQFFGPQKEWLIQYAEKQLKIEYQDYFIFGHRHLPIDYRLSNGKSRYINLGDWLHFFSYGRYEDSKMELLFFENENGKIYS